MLFQRAVCCITQCFSVPSWLKIIKIIFRACFAHLPSYFAAMVCYIYRGAPLFNLNIWNSSCAVKDKMYPQFYAKFMIKLMDETDVYRWGRLILEKCMLWLGDHKETFVLFHFYLVLFYFIYSIAIKIWSRANASYFGQNISIQKCHTKNTMDLQSRVFIQPITSLKTIVSILWASLEEQTGSTLSTCKDIWPFSQRTLILLFLWNQLGNKVSQA